MTFWCRVEFLVEINGLRINAILHRFLIIMSPILWLTDALGKFAIIAWLANSVILTCIVKYIVNSKPKEYDEDQDVS